MKLHELRRKGIACIIAGGPSIGLTQLPAALSAVLAVGAIGKVGEFPTDTLHGGAYIPGLIGSDGVFPAAFTAPGLHVAVTAPGVAVLSSVPGGFAALDGTGIAAANVTGLAALILAHHPIFQGQLKARSDQRVAALFGLIRASAVPRFADPLRGGVGVPELQRVPGLYGPASEPSFAPAPGVFPTTFGSNVFGPSVFGANMFGAGMGSMIPTPGVDRLLPSWTIFNPAWNALGWNPLMQGRPPGLS